MGYLVIRLVHTSTQLVFLGKGRKLDRRAKPLQRSGLASVVFCSQGVPKRQHISLEVIQLELNASRLCSMLKSKPERRQVARANTFT